MIANTIASKSVREITPVFTTTSAEIRVMALITVDRWRPVESCHSSRRCASSSTAKARTAPLVAHSWATGSTESGKTPIESRLTPSPVIACGMSRVAARTRRDGGVRSRSRIRRTHDEPAMIAPLRMSPPLNARLEKSPIMPSRLKYRCHQLESVVVAADTRIDPHSSRPAQSTHVRRGTRSGGPSCSDRSVRSAMTGVPSSTTTTGTVSRASALIPPPDHRVRATAGRTVSGCGASAEPL